jgi:hypothetical protein
MSPALTRPAILEPTINNSAINNTIDGQYNSHFEKCPPSLFFLLQQQQHEQQQQHSIGIVTNIRIHPTTNGPTNKPNGVISCYWATVMAPLGKPPPYYILLNKSILLKHILTLTSERLSA